MNTIIGKSGNTSKEIPESGRKTDIIYHKTNHRPESNGAVIAVCMVSIGMELESACSVVCRFLPKPTAAMNTISVKINARIPFFIGITILGYKDKP